MNKHERYVEVCKQMELLSIKDVSTQRQKNNDTRVWRLPIKCGKNKFIEVASFATGYVRNQNSGYSNYQLNKRCMSEPQYYPEHKYIDGEHKKTGKYLKYTTRGCKLIPNEIDRLEYLIAYCLKNYYIKNANQVVEGRYVSKWYHEFELERANSTYGNNIGAMARVNDMEEKSLESHSLIIDLESETRDLESKYQASQADIRNLENKLDTIKRIADYE